MKKLSYEEIYAELHGSDYKSDLRSEVELLLSVPVSKQDIIIAKVLDIEPMTQDFIDRNFDQVCKYVSTRTDTINMMLELCTDDDSDFRTVSGALSMIEVCLLELSAFNRFLFQVMDSSQTSILYRAQRILPHN